MEIAEAIEQLRRSLDELAADGDDGLARYELRRPPIPPGFLWPLRWAGRRILRWLESIGRRDLDAWPAGLKQVAPSAGTKPLLIWAVGADRATLREACRGFAELQDALPAFAPVLITDVADFAFFARLGWLVEYVPTIAGEGEPYGQRKARFLARLYRGARAIPVSAGLENPATGELRRWLAQDG